MPRTRPTDKGRRTTFDTPMPPKRDAKKRPYAILKEMVEKSKAKAAANRNKQRLSSSARRRSPTTKRKDTFAPPNSDGCVPKKQPKSGSKGRDAKTSKEYHKRDYPISSQPPPTVSSPEAHFFAHLKSLNIGQPKKIISPLSG